MNIRIADIVIELNLLHLNRFSSVEKYVTDGESEFFINSYNRKYDVPNKEVTLKTQFYDLYDDNDKLIQVQYENDEIIGVIEYIGNVINLFLYKNMFSIEYLLSQYAVAYILKKSNSNSIIMHGSSILYKGRGIIFSAKSGTGKSTHAKLWKKLCECIQINDDKNIVKLVNDELYLYSSPWCGKEGINNNIINRLDAVVFLYQNKENKVRKISKLEGMKLLLQQVEKPTKENVDIWNKVIDKILERPIYLYGCNMEDEAFEVLNERLVNDLCL